MASAVVSDNFETSSGAVPELGGADRQTQWCKAWCRFHQTGVQSISGSYNVSSITDIGTGATRINFTTAMPNDDYVALSEDYWYGAGIVDSTTASSFRTVRWNLSAGYADVTEVHVAVFSN